METPPILSPNLEIDQNVVPYEDLKIQGSFGRKQTYPNDQVPTISTLLCLDTNDTPRIARSTPDGHVIVHPDSGSGGGAGFDYVTGYYAESRFNAQVGVFDIIKPAPTKIYAISIHAFAVGMSPSSGGFWGPFTFGYGADSESLLYPLFAGIFSYDPNIPQMINAHLHYDMSFPGGLPITGSYSGADPFSIWIDCTQFNTQVAYSLLYT